MKGAAAVAALIAGLLALTVLLANRQRPSCAMGSVEALFTACRIR